jgi:Tfp pilus assembly ATPase PilU
VHSSHLSVPEILNVMLDTYRGSSDIFFSPSRPPQVEVSGHLVAAVEILKSTIRTREYVEKGESNGKSFVDAMRDGALEGMQHFDAEIERLIRGDLIDMWSGLSYATNPGNLRLQARRLQEASVFEFGS